MDMQFSDTDAGPAVVALVVLDESGRAWDASAKEFVAGYPAGCRIPLLRPEAHPGVVQAVVRGLPEGRVFVYLADEAGKFRVSVPYIFGYEDDTRSAVMGQGL